MTDVRIALPTRRLRVPLRRALEAAARLGADGVQIDLRTELPLADCSRSAVREIRKRLEDCRLAVASVAFPTRRGYGDAEGLDRRVAATRQAMGVAEQLGARVVVNRVGPIPDADDPGRATLVESLTALGLAGERVGARLALQTGPEPPEALAELLEEAPEGTLGVDFQPAELLKQGHAPVAALPSLGPRVLHLTAADAVHDLGASRVVDVPLGRGMVDFPEVLAGLEQHDFRGWVTAGDGAERTEEIGAAVAYLRALLRER